MKMKRMLAMLLVLALVCALLPATALADNASSVTVNGATLTTGQHLVNGDDTVRTGTPASGTGYAYFDTSSGTATLTLNGYDGRYISCDSGDLTISLIGNNHIITSTESAISFGEHSLTIDGNGSGFLMAKSDFITQGHGIKVTTGGNLEIIDCTANVYGYQHGISVEETGTFKLSNSWITAKSGAGRPAFTKAPVMDVDSYTNGYQWNTNNSVPEWKESTTTRFENAESPNFVQIADHGVWVGGVKLVSGQYLANGDTTASDTQPTSGGYAHFFEGTLTLNGITVPANSYHHFEDINGNHHSAAIYTNGDLTINLTGMNQVTGPDVFNNGNSTSYGVYVNGGLTVSDTSTDTGTGTLTATGGNATGEGGYSYGICTAHGITVSGGTVTGTGGNAYYGCCGVIVSGDKITVSEGGTLTGTCGVAEGTMSYGVYANCVDIEVNNGSLTGIAGEAKEASSYGVRCDEGINEGGSITVSSGSLAGTGGSVPAEDSGTYYSYGVYASNAITVSNNSTLTGTGGSAKGSCSSYGVYVFGSAANEGIFVSGGSLTGTGGSTENGSSCGVYAAAYESSQSTITLTGGMVKAVGSTSALSKAPILSYPSGFLCKAGTTTAEPATAGEFTDNTYTYNANHKFFGIIPNSFVGSFTVTYDDNGATTGHSGGNTSYTPVDTIFVLPTTPPLRDNYSFDGWKVTTAAMFGTGFELNKVYTAGNTSLARAYGNVTLTAQWSAVTTQPTISTQPTNQSVTEGQTATFSVTATGNPAPSYKWEGSSDGVTWTAISTATSSSYTTGAMPLSANGSKYRCIISNTNGSITSDVVTLTVTTAPPSTGGGSYTPPASVTDANSFLQLSGVGLDTSDTLIVTQLSSRDPFNIMLTRPGGSGVYGAYDISLASGTKSTGNAMYLKFDLEASYANLVFTLVHKLPDGTFEYFRATADGNGVLVFGPLHSLSPFMLVQGELLPTVTVPEAVVTTAPKTGDAPANTGLWLCLAACVMGAALLYDAKRKAR